MNDQQMAAWLLGYLQATNDQTDALLEDPFGPQVKLSDGLLDQIDDWIKEELNGVHSLGTMQALRSAAKREMLQYGMPGIHDPQDCYYCHWKRTTTLF